MKKILKLLVLIFLYQEDVYASGENKIAIVPEKLTIGEFYEKHIAIGQIKLTTSKDYFTKVSGKVDFVSSVQGSKISKDDIVLTIDREIAEKSKSEAEANLYVADSNYNRDVSLLEKRVVSEEIVNKSKASLEHARNEYTKALNNYNNMVIKAMDNGYIGVIRAKVSDEVKEGDYLFSITAKSDFYVYVELPQILHGRIFTHDIVNAYGEKGKIIPGKILAISDYISNNGTINTKLEFPYSDYLLHGTFVETEIIFNKHKALVLPEKAVLKNNQGNFVYAITPENKVKQVFVTLGIRTDNMIELLSDELKEGDLIVLDGLTKVYDGAEVVIKDQK